GGVRGAYPNLGELRLVDVPGCSPETVAEADRLADRPVACPVIPLPRLYPIAADFAGATCAGRLPDGTQVLAEAPSRDETTAHLFCFTPDGEQTDSREVPLPPECFRSPE